VKRRLKFTLQYFPHVPIRNDASSLRSTTYAVRACTFDFSWLSRQLPGKSGHHQIIRAARVNASLHDPDKVAHSTFVIAQTISDLSIWNKVIHAKKTIRMSLLPAWSITSKMAQVVDCKAQFTMTGAVDGELVLLRLG
jgi:hypothetical protein